jgi:hypothetical protein
MPAHLIRIANSPSRQGQGLIAVTALIGLVITFVAYFLPHGTIAHQWGTLIVLVSTALMVMAALLILFQPMPGWLVTTFRVLIILDILCTGICAYFLEFYTLLALMAVALIGWLIQRGGRSHYPEAEMQP